MSSVAHAAASVEHLLDPRDGSIRVFTFWLADTAYAVSIQHIHSVVRDEQDIRPVPAKTRGLVGTVWYQGSPVPVFDFAQRLGIESGRQTKQNLIEELHLRESEHMQWLQALDASVRTGAAFTEARDPSRSRFGRWYAAFQTRDSKLREILNDFAEPHRRVHALADELLAMRAAGQTEDAIARLQTERMTTLRRMRTLFADAREYLRELSRTVLLFVGDVDGAPRVGLRIDEIDDVVSFSADVFVAADSVQVPVGPELRQMLLGYLKDDRREAILIQPTAVCA